MIGDKYECDGQVEIHEILIDCPKPNAVLGEIKMGGCNHDFVLLRNRLVCTIPRDCKRYQENERDKEK